MAKIENVTHIDYDIEIKTVFVSCTNKDGLISNIDSNNNMIQGLPKNGIIGFLQKKLLNVSFIATGGTYKLLKDNNIPVKEISEITKFPEMESGLVKSLHPRIHAGLLAHKYTASDDEFMKIQKIDYIDMLIANFYPLDKTMSDPNSTIEIIRQNVDVGGPSMSHNARKAYISTAIITDPQNYIEIINELERNNGKISIKTRLELTKKASKMITDYMISVDKYFQSITIEQIYKEYKRGDV